MKLNYIAGICLVAAGLLAVNAAYATGNNRDATAIAGSSSHSSSHASSMSMSQSLSASGAVSSSGGNTQTTTIDNRPAASAPGFGLTSVGSYNCLGSASASVGNGFFSIGGGKTVESVECNRRANADMLIKFGLTQEALKLLCLNAEVASVTPACPKPEAKKTSGDKDEFICARTKERC